LVLSSTKTSLVGVWPCILGKMVSLATTSNFSGCKFSLVDVSRFYLSQWSISLIEIIESMYWSDRCFLFIGVYELSVYKLHMKMSCQCPYLLNALIKFICCEFFSWMMMSYWLNILHLLFFMIWSIGFSWSIFLLLSIGLLWSILWVWSIFFPWLIHLTWLVLLM